MSAGAASRNCPWLVPATMFVHLHPASVMLVVCTNADTGWLEQVHQDMQCCCMLLCSQGATPVSIILEIEGSCTTTT